MAVLRRVRHWNVSPARKDDWLNWTCCKVSRYRRGYPLTLQHKEPSDVSSNRLRVRGFPAGRASCMRTIVISTARRRDPRQQELQYRSCKSQGAPKPESVSLNRRQCRNEFFDPISEKASCQNQQIAMKKIGSATLFYALRHKITTLGTIGQ